MGIQHVAHQVDEGHPRHVRSIDTGCNRVGARSTDEESADATPEVKNTDKVEQRDPRGSAPVRTWARTANQPCEKYVLLPWLSVGQAFEKASERVRDQEGEDEFYCGQGQSIFCAATSRTYVHP